MPSHNVALEWNYPKSSNLVRVRSSSLPFRSLYPRGFQSSPVALDYRGADLTLTSKTGLARAGQELLEKNLGDKRPASIPEESSFRLNSMKRSKNSPSRRSVECSEAMGSERQTVSIDAHGKSLVDCL